MNNLISQIDELLGYGEQIKLDGAINKDISIGKGLSLRDKSPGFIFSFGIRDRKELTAVLTYIVFRLIRKYYEEGKWYDKMDADKICSSAIDEFKRRFLHPYEDQKIKENGDAV